MSVLNEADESRKMLERRSHVLHSTYRRRQRNNMNQKAKFRSISKYVSV